MRDTHGRLPPDSESKLSRNAQCLSADAARKRNPKRTRAFPFLMRTPGRASVCRQLAVLLMLLATAVACSAGGSGTGATTSPSHTSAPASPQASRSAAASASGPSSPVPATGSFGLLVSLPTGPNYTVSLVGVDGKVVASAQASTPPAAPCPVPEPVSTSDSRVYFMDAMGVVRFLSPNGNTGRATTVPVGNARRSMFAVSPDDQRIAVIVEDFTAGGNAATKLYVEDLNGGGHHLDLFSEAGTYTLWPSGWHGPNNLVVAKVPACSGPSCCVQLELHVVDPATAVRRFTIGGPTCQIAGSPSPAGAVCENTADFTRATILNWTGGSVRSFPIHGLAPAFLSPDGSLVALPNIDAGTTTINGANGSLAMIACAWIDSSHLLAGGDAQNQPRVGDVTSGNVVPVTAQGYCVGRLPGGL